jgi:uncharacterized protein GlcG (DUF336 family)
MTTGPIRTLAIARAISVEPIARALYRDPLAGTVAPERLPSAAKSLLPSHEGTSVHANQETRMKRQMIRPSCLAALAALLASAGAGAAGPAGATAAAATRDAPGACAGLPGHAALRGALIHARDAANGGFDLDMWGAVVNRSGVVCAVAFTGADRGSQWPGSRVIAAQKANTANAFSLPGLALSTANLWAAVQPGGSLYGLQHSNPVDTDAAYDGPAADYGQDSDPLVGRRIGGVNVFGGGLALYNARKELVGAIGVSGDTSCADHNIAWRTRHRLAFDWVPAGVSANGDDNINYQGIVAEPSLQADFSHPVCSIAGVDGVSAISAGLPATRK